jgi:NADH-quinone oxidoreductase subunit E
MLTENTKKAILELQQKYPVKRSALIPALHLAQREKGFLPREVQDEVAALFEIASVEVNAIVTFYDMFFEEPVGKHLIHVCKNVSCMLRGGDGLLEKLCHKLQVSVGGTTTDGEFTVIASECLAACDRAPMLLLDDEVLGPVQEERLEQILMEARQKPGHPSPVHYGDENHG